MEKILSSHSHSCQEKILVIGGGNFGTCLADHLAFLNHDITLYCREKDRADAINKDHINHQVFPDFTLNENLKATNELTQELFENADILLFAVPTQFVRDLLQNIKQWVSPQHVLLFVNKGLEVNTLQLPCDIINDVLGKEIGRKAAFLSGPSFAVEIMQREITCVSVASHDEPSASRIRKTFHAPFFKVYISDDPIGVEVGGALKNVLAIAAGIAEGLELQLNARAALITRGLAEVTQIGVMLGGKSITFLGLSGIGDLLLTATSTKSRNFTVGKRLGEGESLENIVQSLGSVAEGVTTSKAAKHLCDKINFKSPIIEEVYNILFESKPVLQALHDLLMIELEEEFPMHMIQRKKSTSASFSALR